MKRILLVLVSPLLIVPFILFWLTSCDSAENQTVLVSKARYAFSFHEIVATPGAQNNIFITEMHDSSTGLSYLIFQDYRGIFVIQQPVVEKDAKPEKP